MYKNLSLLLPAKNELSCIDKVFKELEKINFNSQVLLVVDSIKDNTLKFKKKKYSFKIIKIITNKKGYGAAVIEGIKNCKTKKVCIFNADGSFNPLSLKKMVSLSKKYDHIFCSRYLNNAGSDDDTFLTFIGNKIFKDKKLKRLIASTEYKFWKFISGRKYLNPNLANLDIRLLKNFADI